MYRGIYLGKLLCLLAFKKSIRFSRVDNRVNDLANDLFCLGFLHGGWLRRRDLKVEKGNRSCLSSKEMFWRSKMRVTERRRAAVLIFHLAC